MEHGCMIPLIPRNPMSTYLQVLAAVTQVLLALDHPGIPCAPALLAVILP